MHSTLRSAYNASVPPRMRSLSAHATASEEETTETPSSDLSDDEILFRSVKKELLRVGKHGVAPSHVNSLKDLISQHPTGVKVKVYTDSEEYRAKVIPRQRDSTPCCRCSRNSPPYTYQSNRIGIIHICACVGNCNSGLCWEL